MGDNMAYSLMVESLMDNKKHYINLFGKKEDKGKVTENLWDIDLFTSCYSSEMEFLEYLKSIGQIDFSLGRVYIEEYNSENFSLYFPIFNSTLINEAAKSVQNSNIRPSMIREYSDFKEEKIQKIVEIDDNVIKTRVNINNSLKNYLLKYKESKIKEQSYGWRDEIYNDIGNHNDNISKYLIQYKSFREIYSVIEQYEKNGCTKYPVSYNLYKQYLQQKEDGIRYGKKSQNNNENNSSDKSSSDKSDSSKVKEKEELKELKEEIINYWNATNVNTGNLDREEFLSEEECEEAYCDYHRGAK